MSTLFPTITDRAWRAMFAAYRAQGHYEGAMMLRQIRERVRLQKLCRSAHDSDRSAREDAATGSARLPEIPRQPVGGNSI